MARTKQKTLTQGVLIFAFNNEHIDYIAMAAWSAKNIRRHLNLPVACVTDNPEAAAQYEFEHIVVTAPDTGGARYFADYKQTITWHNAGRINAYELSPFDQTLVLDADYVVASDRLLDVLKIPQQFAAFFELVQNLMTEGKLLAYHDRSDGGLFATLAEMCFAGQVGIHVDLGALATHTPQPVQSSGATCTTYC
jgi:hypothetical protein